MDIILELLSLGTSVAALIISIKAWTKSRAVYSIESTFLGRGDNAIKEKLSSGEYTVIASYHEGTFPNDNTRIILGRIKKSK